MPGDVVNLRRFRKAKARDDKAREADENRSRHGLTRAAREQQEVESKRDARRLDGHRLRPDDGSEPSGDGS